jgi:hypothetical protein
MANYIVKEHNGSDGADSRTKSTFAVWVKRCRTGVAEQIWSWGENNSSDARLKFQSSDILRLHSDGTGSPIETTRKFRDTNGWYHFVVTFDGSNGTEAHRRRIWINGEEWVHGASTSTFSSAVAGHNSTQDLYIGDNARMQQNASNAEPFVGYMSHFHYCDGYAYTAADFGEFDSTTGEWKAITAPSVNYGTHGIFLKMEDSANMDLDSSPNASTQLSTTGTILSSKDCPSDVYCTLSRIGLEQWTLSNGNLEISGASDNQMVVGTMHSNAGYYECKIAAPDGNTGKGIRLGLCKVDGAHAVSYSGISGNSGDLERFIGFQNTAGGYKAVYNNGYTVTDFGGTSNANDIMQVAWKDGKVWYGVNGTWLGSGDPSAGTNHVDTLPSGSMYAPAVISSLDGADGAKLNFGNGYFGTTAISSEGTNASGIGKFEYDVPTGCTAVSTKGLNE